MTSVLTSAKYLKETKIFSMTSGSDFRQISERKKFKDKRK
jgi:hypothetical protein